MEQTASVLNKQDRTSLLQGDSAWNARGGQKKNWEAQHKCTKKNSIITGTMNSLVGAVTLVSVERFKRSRPL